MRDDLPPLPLGEYMGSCNGVPSYRYTAEHMRAYACRAIALVLEQAARPYSYSNAFPSAPTKDYDEWDL